MTEKCKPNHSWSSWISRLAAVAVLGVTLAAMTGLRASADEATADQKIIRLPARPAPGPPPAAPVPGLERAAPPRPERADVERLERIERALAALREDLVKLRVPTGGRSALLPPRQAELARIEQVITKRLDEFFQSQQDALDLMKREVAAMAAVLGRQIVVATPPALACDGEALTRQPPSPSLVETWRHNWVRLLSWALEWARAAFGRRGPPGPAAQAAPDVRTSLELALP